MKEVRDLSKNVNQMGKDMAELKTELKLKVKQISLDIREYNGLVGKMSDCVSMIEDNASDIGELKKCIKGREDDERRPSTSRKNASGKSAGGGIRHWAALALRCFLHY